MRAVLDEVRLGAYIPPSTETVGEYLAGWLERAKPNLRQTSWDGYRKDVTHLTSRLGSVPLQQLKPVQLEACSAELATSGGMRGQGLSAKTIGNTHAVLRYRVAAPAPQGPGRWATRSWIRVAKRRPRALPTER